MRRSACSWLSFRTSLERIAPESLTPKLYDFVHGDIWLEITAQLQDGVAGHQFKWDFGSLKVNGTAESVVAEESRTLLGPYCVFEPLLVGVPAWIGIEMNSEASSTA